jgi:hypothetical protein
MGVCFCRTLNTVSILVKISQKLANLKDGSVQDVERVFACTLQQDEFKPGQFRGSPADPYIDALDLRIGDTGGVVVVNFKQEVQAVLAEEFELLGPLKDIDVVSPPIGPASPPPWTRKWSAGHSIDGVKIWFGFEEVDEKALLLYASRSFPG